MIVAFDGSTRSALLFLLCDDSGPITQTHWPASAQELAELLRPLLRENVINRVVVASGPGSYTGIRVAASAALGIADARSVPLATIASMDIAAQAAPSSTGFVYRDAGRGRVFCSRKETLGESWAVSPPALIDRAELAEIGDDVFGDDDTAWKDRAPQALAHLAVTANPAETLQFVYGPTECVALDVVRTTSVEMPRARQN